MRTYGEATISILILTDDHCNMWLHVFRSSCELTRQPSRSCSLWGPAVRGCLSLLLLVRVDDNDVLHATEALKSCWQQVQRHLHPNHMHICILLLHPAEKSISSRLINHTITLAPLYRSVFFPFKVKRRLWWWAVSELLFGTADVN